MGKTMDYEHKGHPQKRLRQPESKTMYHASNFSPQRVERQIATDNRLTFQEDVEAVLVNLSMTEWTCRAELHDRLKARRLGHASFEDGYLNRLLAHLLQRRRIVEDGGCWKKT